MDLTTFVGALLERCRATPGITSLVVFGSTSSASAERRDAWSDADFGVFAAPEAQADIDARWDFLPYPERLVLTAREGHGGGVALYDDGTLAEFGAGTPWTITDPDREVLLGGDDLTFADPGPLPEPADQAGLFLVKLLIGVGRARRGERVAGSCHVRCYALTALCEALRQRLAPDAPRSPFDPLRRLEQALPEVAARIADLLDRDLETCARGLFELARDELQPGWPQFPAAAWRTVGHRLGWS